MLGERTYTAEFASFRLSRVDNRPSCEVPQDDETLRGLHLMKLSTWAGMFAFGGTVWGLVIWLPYKFATAVLLKH